MAFRRKDQQSAQETEARITALNHQLAETQRLSEHLRGVLDTLFVFVGLMRPDGTLIEANRHALTAASLTRDAVLSKPFWETYWWSYSPEVQAQLKDACQRAAQGIAVRYDVVVRLGDDEFTTIDFQVAPLFDKAGKVAFLVPSAVDISARVQMQEALRVSRDRFSAALEDSPVTIFNQDRDLRYTWIRYPASGYSPDDVLGKTDAELLPAEYAQPLADIKHSVLETGTRRREDVTTLVDGGERFYDLTVVPLYDEDGRVVGVTCAAVDITDRKALERERDELLRREQEARREAERASELRNQFMAMVAHDLRSPLTSVFGFAETLLAEDVEWDPASQREFIQMIRDEARRLNGMIDGLLELSRARAGEPSLRLTRTSVREIVDEAQAQLIMLAPRHRLVTDIPPDLPAVAADQERVIRVLTNLVSNAAKYSPEGTRISIRAHRMDGAVQVDVSDEGQGIPPEAREIVFEPFQRLESGTHNEQSAGLGLAICKAIVEAHGGRIWIQDRAGPGTTVSYTLPLSSSEAAE